MTQRAQLAFGEIMDLAVGLGGTITGEHGVGRLKRPWLAGYSAPRRWSSTAGSSRRSTRTASSTPAPRSSHASAPSAAARAEAVDIVYASVVFIRHDSEFVSRTFQPRSDSPRPKPGPTRRRCTRHCVTTTRFITLFPTSARERLLGAVPARRHVLAARDHATFSSAKGLTIDYDELNLIGMADNPPMVMQDPPIHTEFRRLVSRGFTPRQVEAVEPAVRESYSSASGVARGRRRGHR